MGVTQTHFRDILDPKGPVVGLVKSGEKIKGGTRTVQDGTGRGRWRI